MQDLTLSLRSPSLTGILILQLICSRIPCAGQDEHLGSTIPQELERTPSHFATRYVVQDQAHFGLVCQEFGIRPRETYVDEDIACLQSGNLVVLLMLPLGSLQDEEIFSRKMMCLGSLLPARHDATTLKKDRYVSWVLESYLKYPTDSLRAFSGT